MSTIDYYREIAKEIKLLMVSRSLINDHNEDIKVHRPKKSQNRIIIYINNYARATITVIKQDKFVVSKQLFRNGKPEIINFNDKEDLMDYIIKSFL